MNRKHSPAGIFKLSLPAIPTSQLTYITGKTKSITGKTKSGTQAALGYDVLPGGKAYAVASFACSSPRLSMA